MLPLSVWESESFFRPRDYIIIGSGLTGLWAAYYLKKKHPKRTVLILERGIIPSGASTRNAGFACFGSYTELLADENSQGREAMLELVEMRIKGLRKIAKVFDDDEIGYEMLGGYEWVTNEKFPDLDELRSGIDRMNNLLRPLTDGVKTFQIHEHNKKTFGLGGDGHLIRNRLEGQLHSGKLSEALLQLVQSMGVMLLTNTEIREMKEDSGGVTLTGNLPVTFRAGKVLICTNAFARTLLPELDVKPARGQVLVTAPIDGLKLRGTFHYDEGYYYFRNLDNRILLGGARNKFIEEEETFSSSTSQPVQDELERFLRETIIPGIPYQIEQRWSGTMGMGREKKPVVKMVSNHVACAVRMSGMGVALSPQVAKDAAALLD